jgi:hypothetical protein
VQTYAALGLNEIGAKPGGTPRTFCDPEKMTSISHESVNTGTPPNDATVSTTSKELYLLS